jgi:hypothetical protein
MLGKIIHARVTSGAEVKADSQYRRHDMYDKECGL